MKIGQCRLTALIFNIVMVAIVFMYIVRNSARLFVFWLIGSKEDINVLHATEMVSLMTLSIALIAYACKFNGMGLLMRSVMCTIIGASGYVVLILNVNDGRSLDEWSVDDGEFVGTLSILWALLMLLAHYITIFKWITHPWIESGSSGKVEIAEATLPTEIVISNTNRINENVISDKLSPPKRISPYLSAIQALSVERSHRLPQPPPPYEAIEPMVMCHRNDLSKNADDEWKVRRKGFFC